MNAELPPLPVIFEDENGDQDGAAYTSAEMNRYAEVAAARERILQARIAELEADAERYRAALDWIATVNAMDYEYVRVARSAIDAARSTE